MNAPEKMQHFAISLDEIVTSDTHFGHANVIEYCQRPFKDLDHMDTVMVDNWNQVVGDPTRRLWHLGDWAMRGTNYKLSIMPRLIGHKVIVKGNHDPSRAKLVEKFGFQEAYREVEGHFIETGKTFYMSHIPDASKASQYDYCFCGHVHLLFAKDGNTYNVGADIWDYKPQTFRFILEHAADKQAQRPVQLTIDQSLDARDRGVQARLMAEKE